MQICRANRILALGLAGIDEEQGAWIELIFGDASFGSRFRSGSASLLMEELPNIRKKHYSSNPPFCIPPSCLLSLDARLKRPGSGPGEADSTRQHFLHPLPRLAQSHVKEHEVFILSTRCRTYVDGESDSASRSVGIIAIAMESACAGTLAHGRARRAIAWRLCYYEAFCAFADFY